MFSGLTVVLAKIATLTGLSLDYSVQHVVITQELTVRKLHTVLKFRNLA